MIPGEVITHQSDIELNYNATSQAIVMTNTADMEITIGSHANLFFINSAMSFDRTAASGKRLDIPAGTTVIFEPGEVRTVNIIAIPFSEVGDQATQHTGYVSITNNWTEALANLTFKYHHNGLAPDAIVNFTRMCVKEQFVNCLEIQYETGVGASFDYWWIEFTTESGKKYTMKNNFYCNITSSDDGYVKISIDGQDQALKVSFSSSSSCSVSIYSA